MAKFKKIFRRLRDPRAANASHDLLEVLLIALAAVLCGAESCSDMASLRTVEGRAAADFVPAWTWWQGQPGRPLVLPQGRAIACH
jgi:hypothetical protein